MDAPKDNVVPFPVKMTEAEQRIAEIRAVIAQMDPSIGIEVTYVLERLQYLLSRHGQAGVLAVMLANFEIAKMNGS